MRIRFLIWYMVSTSYDNTQYTHKIIYIIIHTHIQVYTKEKLMIQTTEFIKVEAYFITINQIILYD